MKRNNKDPTIMLFTNFKAESNTGCYYIQNLGQHLISGIA